MGTQLVVEKSAADMILWLKKTFWRSLNLLQYVLSFIVMSIIEESPLRFNTILATVYIFYILHLHIRFLNWKFYDFNKEAIIQYLWLFQQLIL